MNCNISLECLQRNTKVLHCRDLLANMEETIGERLKRLRIAAKLTQAKLAKDANIGQSAIGNIEAGTRGYGASVVAIAKVLGVTPEHLQLVDSESGNHKPNRPLALVDTGDSAINSDSTMADVMAALAGKFEGMDASTRKLAIALIGQLADNPQDHARIAAMIELSIAPGGKKVA